jgi:CheY-like chemotaxis protein
MTANQKLILVVDDDIEILKLTNKILRGAGFLVSVTHSAESAREQIRKESPHLIISDLNMEPEDGYSFISSVRKVKESQQTPIIVLSALNEFDQVKRAMTLGISDYVVKPLNAATLLSKINKALPGLKKIGWKPPSSEDFRVNIELNAQVTEIGDVGYKLAGPFKISPGQKLDVYAPDFKLHGLDEYPQQSAGLLKSHLLKGHFVNNINFVKSDSFKSQRIDKLLKQSLRS